MTEKFDTFRVFIKRVLEISSKGKNHNRKTYACQCWIEDNLVEVADIRSDNIYGKFALTCLCGVVLFLEEEGLLNL